MTQGDTMSMPNPNKQRDPSEQLANTLYYVECQLDPTVLVAMNTKVMDDYVSWFDTVKERMMRVKTVVNPDPNQFAFERADGQEGAVYSFMPMTVDVYNQFVKPKLPNGTEFTDDAALQKAFKDTIENAW